MSVPAIGSFDPTQFFRPRSTDGTAPQRLDTQVGGVAVSNDLSGRLSVTTAEGDKITLTAKLESDFRSVNYQSHVETDGRAVDVNAHYAELSLRKEFGVTVEGDLNEQEVHDLAKLFRNVTNIFRKYFNGQDEEALAKTAKLAERFGRFSSLTGLDLSVDVERSVTAVAARIAAASSPSTGASTSLSSNPVAKSDPDSAQPATPGAAPSTAAVIPPPSSDSTAPTQPPLSEPSAAASGTARVTVPAVDDQTRASLVDQILNAVQDAKVESGKVRKYLPRLLDKIREDARKELKGDSQTGPTQAAEAPDATAGAAFFSYQSFKQTSITLSIHS